MRLPDLVAYHTAVQHPAAAFDDPDLRMATVTTNRLGLPRVAAGNFALTYQLVHSGRRWAVRCFHRESVDRARRYAAISRTLAAICAESLVTISYLPAGVRVDQQWYPITKMPWLDGRPLNRAVEARLSNPASLSDLEQRFVAMVAELRRLGIAHGDLQHGNVLVDQSGRLTLVDYDGMFVPALSGLAASECGDPNYQHPAPKDQFDAELDRFSALVIVVALRVLAVAPDLWRTYNSDDNLLFRHADFVSPGSSALFRDLRANTATSELAERLANVCQSDYAKIPPLADFLQRPGRPVLLRLADVVALNRLYASNQSRRRSATSAKPTRPVTSTRDSWRVRRAIGQEALAFSPDGAILATAESGGRIRLRETRSGRAIHVYDSGSRMTAVAFSRDGRQFAATGPDGALHVWQTSGQRGGCSGTTSRGETRALVFTRGDPAVAVAQGHTIVLHRPGGDREIRLGGLRRDISSLAFSENGRILVAVAVDGSLRCWSVADGRLLAAARQHGLVNSIAVSADGRVFASAGASAVGLWNGYGGGPIARLPVPDDRSPVRVAFSAHGTQLVAAVERRVLVWTTADAQLVHNVPGPVDRATGLAFSPDERSVAITTSGGTISLRALAGRRHAVAEPATGARQWLLDVLHKVATAAGAF